MVSISGEQLLALVTGYSDTKTRPRALYRSAFRTGEQLPPSSALTAILRVSYLAEFFTSLQKGKKYFDGFGGSEGFVGAGLPTPREAEARLGAEPEGGGGAPPAGWRPRWDPPPVKPALSGGGGKTARRDPAAPLS